MGFGSMHEFLVKHLGYSEGSAHRRIASMRLMKDLPEVKSQIESGALSMSTAATFQGFLQNEKRVSGKIYGVEEKKRILDSLQGKSKREVEKRLCEISPQAVSSERERVLTPDTTEVRWVMSAKLEAKLGEIRSLLSHRFPMGVGYSDLIEYMADVTLEKLRKGVGASRGIGALKLGSSSRVDLVAKPDVSVEPGLVAKPDVSVEPGSVAKSDVSVETGSVVKPNDALSTRAGTVPPSKNQTDLFQNTPPAGFEPKRSRYVSRLARKIVWNRAQGRCEFVDSEAGRRCESRWQLEFDHRTPFGRGGGNSAENIRLLCRDHNATAAVQEYGGERMRFYRSS